MTPYSFTLLFHYSFVPGSCTKSHVLCVVLGVMRVVRPVHGMVPDLGKLIRENEEEDTHTKAERWIKDNNLIQIKISKNFFRNLDKVSFL